MEDREIKICETIRELRRKRDITQETLSQALSVSVQAVSKWETSSSLPDIALLPKLATFFGISLDNLFYGLPEESIISNLPFPDDLKHRIVQYRGNTLLSADDYDKNIKIPLKVERLPGGYSISVEIWGSADIEGDISGGLKAGDGVNCGTVNGGVHAGDGVNCGTVNGGVKAGDAVNCGTVYGDVKAGDGVNCGNVEGSVSAGDGINCGNIDGDISSCAGDIHCHEIKGNVHCEGNIIYEK